MAKDLYTLSRPISKNDKYAILNGNVFYLAIDKPNNIIRITFPDESDFICITPQEFRNEPNSLHLKALSGIEYDFINLKSLLPSSDDYLYKAKISKDDKSDDSNIPEVLKNAPAFTMEELNALSDSKETSDRGCTGEYTDNKFDFDELERKLEELEVNDDDIDEARTIIKAALKDMVLVVETIVDSNRKLTKQTPAKIVDILDASQNPPVPKWWMPKEPKPYPNEPLVCIESNEHTAPLATIGNVEVKCTRTTFKFNKRIDKPTFIRWLKENHYNTFYDIMGDGRVWYHCSIHK